MRSFLKGSNVIMLFGFNMFPPNPCPNNPEIIEGSLEVKLPTIWTVEKQR
jgi:hypothetical protein